MISGLGIRRLQEVGNAADAMAKRTLVMERIAAQWLVATSTNSIRTPVPASRPVTALPDNRALPSVQAG